MILRGTLVGLAAVLMLVACSSKSSDPPSGGQEPSLARPTSLLPQPGSLPDVCARVPAADVARVAQLAAPLRAAPKAETRLDAECEYTAGDRTVVDVDFLPEAREAFDSSRQALAGGEDCVNEPGVGDAAYRCTDPLGRTSLWAYLGDHTIEVSADYPSGEAPAPVLQALARFALTKL